METIIWVPVEGGRKFSVRRWEPTGEVKGVVVAIHGLTSHSGWFRALAKSLALRGYEVLAPDRRGTGLSQNFEGVPAEGEIVEDIRRIVRLASALSEDVTLLCWCWGSKTGVIAAVDQELIKRVVFAAPGLYASQLVAENWKSLQPQDGYLSLPYNQITDFSDDPDVRHFIEEDDLRLTRVPTGLRDLTKVVSPNSLLAFPKINVPVLCILAQKDKIVDNAATKNLMRNVKILEVDSGHAFILEQANAEIFAVEMEKFSQESAKSKHQGVTVGISKQSAPSSAAAASPAVPEASAEAVKPRINPLVPLLAAVALDATVISIIVPLLPYYKKTFDASALSILLMFSVYSLCQMIASPYLGKLSDRFGRKRILIISQVGTTLGLVVLAFANSLELVIVARVIDGISGGAMSIVNAAVGDLVKPGQKVVAFGRVPLAYAFGMLIAPMLPLITGSDSPQLAVFICVGLSLLSMAMTIFLLPSMAPKAEAVRAVVKSGATKMFARKGPRLAIARLAVFHLIYGTYFTSLALVCNKRFTDFGPAQIGWVYAYIGLIMLVMQLFVLKRLTKLGESRSILISFVVGSIGYFSLLWTQSPWNLIWILPMIHFLIGAARPSLLGFASRVVRKSDQGYLMGLNQSLVAGAQVVGPAVSGLVLNSQFGNYWPCIPLVLCAISIAFVAVEPAPSGYIGCTLVNVDATSDEAGVVVEAAAPVVIEIDEKSPGYQAGLRIHDRIVSINGQPVRKVSDAMTILSSLPLDNNLSIKVSREDKQEVFDFPFSERRAA